MVEQQLFMSWGSSAPSVSMLSTQAELQKAGWMKGTCYYLSTHNHLTAWSQTLGVGMAFHVPGSLSSCLCINSECISSVPRYTWVYQGATISVICHIKSETALLSCMNRITQNVYKFMTARIRRGIQTFNSRQQVSTGAQLLETDFWALHEGTWLLHMTKCCIIIFRTKEKMCFGCTARRYHAHVAGINWKQCLTVTFWNFWRTAREHI